MRRREPVLLAGIRERYPEWRLLVDGDGGDENLKDYPIEENSELTIRSVVNNRMLYQEGWGVDSIKHSLTYSGGYSRACVRSYACAREYGFVGFSPYTRPSVIAVAEAIPFAELTNGSHERLYALKGEIVARGVRSVLGLEMPIFAKRRFQHGSAAADRKTQLFPHERGAIQAALRGGARCSGVSATTDDRRIRSLRPPKPLVDPWRAHGWLVEDERRPNGNVERALTVFLAGAECPFTCSFCDMWRGTIDVPTPRGALPQQLTHALHALDGQAAPDRLKLYNASNFFDRRAVPAEDVPAIAALAAPFAAVTVESHASTIGPLTLELAQQIAGRLEVAIGLETIHPIAAARLNKQLELARFDRAARFLSDNDIDLRVFVLLGAPNVPFDESVEWTCRTVEYAVQHGASVVSIIPVRGGNGEMERLAALGEFTAPTLAQLEAAVEHGLTCAPAIVMRRSVGRRASRGMFRVRCRAYRTAATHQRDGSRAAGDRVSHVRVVTTSRCDVAIVGSGFAGSLMARLLAVLGYEVVLLERGTHPRFAIGESSTPLANLSLERLGRRYGLADCYRLAAHGRWREHFPELRCGLKRGFTFYRHHPFEALANRGLDSERLLVAASPNDDVADTHWVRADIDHHFVRQALAAGVDYRDRTELTGAAFAPSGVRLTGQRNGAAFDLDADFVIDASGPGGFLARQLSIPSGLERTETRSALVFSHFADPRMMPELVPGLPEGPYPDDWAAVHHLIDEGWMYSLRFDDGVTSAGFALTPRGLAGLNVPQPIDAAALWRVLLERYPTIAGAFAEARPLMPVAFHARIQHRLTRAAGERWALLPHAYAFVDPLFSTGIAWSLRAIERLALLFEPAAHGRRIPHADQLTRYEKQLSAEADQIDRLVAGAYDAMAHFDLFAAHAMIYFATVSFAEAHQRIVAEDSAAWSGFLGVGDTIAEPLFAESLQRLRRITRGSGLTGSVDERREYAQWATDAIAPRNVAGLADPQRHNLYPVDLDLLIERHALFGLSRDQIVAALPALRGMAPEPLFADWAKPHESARTLYDGDLSGRMAVGE